MKHNTLTKIITLALAAVLALSLAACGSKTNDDSGDKTDAPVIKIGVPNDTTNEARALLLLADNGILKLREGAGLTATRQDIVEYTRKVEIVELEAAQVARMRKDVALVVLNGNYALQAGLSVGRDAILAEKPDSQAAKTYVNIITVKEGRQDEPIVKALVEVLKSEPIRAFIREKYDGAVVPFEE